MRGVASAELETAEKRAVSITAIENDFEIIGRNFCGQEREGRRWQVTNFRNEDKGDQPARRVELL